MHNCYIQNELSYCHAVCESHFVCPFCVSWRELVIRLIKIQTILLNLADIGPNVCVACKLMSATLISSAKRHDPAGYAIINKAGRLGLLKVCQ